MPAMGKNLTTSLLEVKVAEPLGVKSLGYRKNPQLWVTFPRGIHLTLTITREEALNKTTEERN